MSLKSSNLKHNILVPLFSTLFILLNQVLSFLPNIPNISGQPKRYLLFWLIFLMTSTGYNLIPLHLGYSMSSASRERIQNINKIIIGFIITQLALIVISILIFKMFSFYDLLVTFFPVSRDTFPLASSILLWYIFSNRIYSFLLGLSSKTKKIILFFFVWFFLVIPTLFGKQVWGIGLISNPLTSLALFSTGVILKQENLINKIKVKNAIILTSLVVLILTGLTILLKINPIFSMPNYANSRFFSLYSFPIVILSVSIFCLLARPTLIWNKTFHSIFFNWLLLVSYFSMNAPITKYSFAQKIPFPNKLSGFSWSVYVLRNFLIAIILSITITVTIKIIFNLKSSKRLLRKIYLQQPQQLLDTPSFIASWIKQNWHILLVIGTGYTTTFIQMFLLKSIVDKTVLSNFEAIITLSTPQLVLSTIIFLLFFTLLMMIMNRFWYSYFICLIFSIIISISEVLKVMLRDEPILPTDLNMITGIREILDMVNPIIVALTLLFILIITITGIILQKKYSHLYRISYKFRIITSVLILVFFSGAFFVNHTNSLPNIVFKAFNIPPSFFEQATGAIKNGPIIQFINNVDVKIMNKPSGYSKKEVTKIMQKYSKQAYSINKTRTNTLNNQNVIFVLSESFSNPNRVPNITVKPNPIPKILDLKKQYPSGLMLSSGYGGGTANMEWQALTGLSLSNLSPTLATPYTQIVSSQKISPSFTDLFDTKTAIHPFTANLYDRKKVFKKFKFGKFYYLGSKYKIKYKKKIPDNPYISDESAYDQTLKELKKSNTGSKFIQLSTMQNHMPYNYSYANNNFKVSGNGATDENKKLISTYSKGLNYTDKSVKSFISALNKMDKSVTVVWYGDHLASLYNNDTMKKHGISLHETDYFIYNNKTKKLQETPNVCKRHP